MSWSHLPCPRLLQLEIRRISYISQTKYNMNQLPENSVLLSAIMKVLA